VGEALGRTVGIAAGAKAVGRDADGLGAMLVAGLAGVAGGLGLAAPAIPAKLTKHAQNASWRTLGMWHELSIVCRGTSSARPAARIPSAVHNEVPPGRDEEDTMATSDRYPEPLDSMDWQRAQSFATTFSWEYDDGRDKLLNLYRKGKKLQWDAAERIDWSQDLDPENPSGLPDEVIPIFGSDVWMGLTVAEKARVRTHFQAWQLSQFLHGEQGALVCTAKIVQQVPTIDAKFYAATQVIDEARHVEAYARLLHDKFDLVYPINPHLKQLLDDTLGDSRWDFTYLGMQVLIEGVALAAFGLIRDQATNPLAQSVTAYVMQDEARHVAFGRLALRDYYPELSDKERDEREEFIVEGCYLLRDRFLGEELWQNLGLPVDACKRYTNESETLRLYRTSLFTRIVPTIKEIGLWGPRIRRAYADMGILGFADADLDALGQRDEEIALELDRRRKDVESVAALAANS
jgi:para-aminobenzoate N-oxygenase AurF